MECLISRWSTDSHTLVVAWGEVGPTLENVCTLTALPLFVEAHTVWIILVGSEVGVSEPRFDRVEIFYD